MFVGDISILVTISWLQFQKLEVDLRRSQQDNSASLAAP
jgi:hypothetical protein